MPWSLLSLLLLVVSVATADNKAWPHAYDSIITRTVRSSVFWQVSNDECTAVHAYNVSSGALNWERAPIDPDQSWSTQMTEKRTFYTLKTGGPQVTAVSLDTGNVRWTWPDRVGPPFRKHWDTDLPQSAPLATPLPAITVQQLVLRLKEAGAKLLGLNLYNGSVVWECDVTQNISTAAQVAGLPAPTNISISTWLVGGSGTVLYVSLTAQHAASGAPANLHLLQQEQQQRQADGREAGLSHLAILMSGVVVKQGTRQHAGQGAGPQNVHAQANAAPTGWVLALDLSSGTILWVSGPLEQGPLSLTLTEPALLAASQRDEAGSGWLYGLHKESGAALYSLPCAGGPCMVQVEDTQIGLLTASLLQQPPFLDSLAAFELASGKELWRGIQGSKLQPMVVGQCTGLTDPTMVSYVACTCNAVQAVQAGFTAASEAPSVAGAQHTTQDDSAGAAGSSDVDHKHDSHHAKPSKPHPKPRPRPDPQPGPGLCGFAISTSTGKLVYEVLLSATDQVPEDAALYGMKPYSLADLMVFPGRKAVYAMQRSPASANQAGDSSLWQQVQQPIDNQGSQEAGNDVSDAGAVEARMQPLAFDGGMTQHSKAVLWHGSSAAAIAEQALHTGAPEWQQQARLVFSFALPVGVVLQAWDWMDLKSGVLLLRASPHFEGPPIPPDVNTHTHNSPKMSEVASTTAAEADHGIVTSATTGHYAATNAGRAARFANEKAHASSSMTRSLLGPGLYTQHNPSLLMGASSGVPNVQHAKPRPSPGTQEEAPQTWLFALSPANGSQIWSLSLDVWVPPLTQHALPHEWGRGGVLLVDGCRPPDSETGADGRLVLRGGDGTTCCLHAISLADGKLQWQNCFDMDHACDSGMARRTATTIVFCLLAAQVLVLVLGFALGVWWHVRMRRRPPATIMQDPDSEDEALIVQVLPSGYSIATSGRVS